MELSNGRNLLLEQPAGKIWVVRFTRPDPRVQLDGPGAEDCDLYQDLRSAVLDHLARNESLILNFGLVHFFPSAFYQLLLKVRERILQQGARLILCGFTPEVQESIRLFKSDKIFEITTTEEQATRHCSQSAPINQYQKQVGQE